MARRGAKNESIRPGQVVKITADVGVVNSDDSSVPSAELHGEVVKVCPRNSIYIHKDTGEEMAGVSMSNGALAAVPTRALSPVRKRTRTGWTRRFAAGFAAAFAD